jgi:hypothetical protein
MNKEEAINKVNEGIGSIYTKEDVINIINKIEGNEVYFDGEKIVKAINTAWEKDMSDMIDEAKDQVQDNDSVDMNECEMYMENDNRVVLNDVTWNNYIIEDIFIAFTDSIRTMVQEVIVEACSEDDTHQEELDKASEEGSTEHQ